MIDGMGDKASAKATMIAAGVPCIPGSEGIIDTLEEAKKNAIETGYPVIIKATAGGGGKGMRIIWSEDEMEPNWDSAKQEALASFGNDGMYMEKFIEEPRHVEIQIIADQLLKAVFWFRNLNVGKLCDHRTFLVDPVCAVKWAQVITGLQAKKRHKRDCSNSKATHIHPSPRLLAVPLINSLPHLQYDRERQ